MTPAERAQRNARVVDLHLAGTATAAIAEQLKMTPSAIRKIISVGLAERVGDHTVLPDDARTELARIDGMLAGIWHAARGGDLNAIDRVTRLNERREKIARPRVNEHRLRAAVDTAIASSTEINPNLDAAVTEGAQLLADHLDDVLSAGTSAEITRALYLIPHLKNFLDAMLATPAARRAAGVAAQQSGRTRLAHLQNVTSIARGGPN